MQMGWVKIGDYLENDTRQTHGLGVEYALYRMAHDLECPPFSAFCTVIHSFVTGEPRDFKFDTVTNHSKSYPADSLKGAW